MHPIDLKTNDVKSLEIHWSDGHVSVYDLTYLRRACPCAHCEEGRRQPEEPSEHGLKVLSGNEILSSKPRIVQADVVGRYALKFVWADGHDEGIYTFAYLRQLCQCGVCSAAKSD